MRIGGLPDPGLAALQRLVLGALPTAATTTAAAAVPPVGPTAAAAALAQSPTSVEMLVAIAAADPVARRRQSVAVAEKGLAGLERLALARQVGRLGRRPVAALADIAAWMADQPVADDPDAARLFREIELRVLVELAKDERGD